MKFIGRDPLIKPASINELADIDLSGIANGNLLSFDGSTFSALITGSGGGLDADLLDGLDSTAFATASQGSLADSALQPGDDADVLGSGDAASGTFLASNGDGTADWQNLPNVDTLSSGGATDGQVLTADGSGGAAFEDLAAGDVNGPSSATDTAMALFDGTSGKLIKDSGIPFSLLTYKFSYSSVAGYNTKGSQFFRDDQAEVYKWALPSLSQSRTTDRLSAGTLLSGSRDIGFSNSAVAGYVAHYGTTKFAFPNDTVSSLNVFTNNFGFGAGCSNPSVAAYVARGVNTSELYKFAFANDTVSTTTSLPDISSSVQCFSNPFEYGYFARSNNQTDVYKIQFSSDTVSTTNSAPSNMNNFDNGFSNPSVAGYALDGQSPTSIFQWSFPSDSVSTAANLGFQLQYGSSWSNPTVGGYTANAYASAIVEFKFTTNTISSISETFPTYGISAGFANA